MRRRAGDLGIGVCFVLASNEYMVITPALAVHLIACALIHKSGGLIDPVVYPVRIVNLTTVREDALQADVTVESVTLVSLKRRAVAATLWKEIRSRLTYPEKKELSAGVTTERVQCQESNRAQVAKPARTFKPARTQTEQSHELIKHGLPIEPAHISLQATRELFARFGVNKQIARAVTKGARYWRKK